MIPTRRLDRGFELPVLGLGTWQMGGRHVVDRSYDEQNVQGIQAAIDAGVSLIDTAESYGAGHAEELIAQAIANYERSRLCITSKVHTEHLAPRDVRQSLVASLQRLNLEYLDLYLIHWPSDDVPLAETLGALDVAVDDGLVRWIGVSNFSKERLAKAQRIARHPIVVNQVYYNLTKREPEHTGLLQYCQNSDVILQAYRPLEKGSLLVDPPAILVEIGERYGKTPAQVAINWLASQSNVTTLVKTSSSKHLPENLEAVGWQLDPDDIERLRRDFPGQRAYDEKLHLS